MPDQGDIVLIPVPFTDLTSQKRRRVIVVSNNSYNRGGDLVVVAMTSRTSLLPYAFQISNADLIEGALNRPGTVRADKVYTLASAIVVKKFGKVAPSVVERIRHLLDALTFPTP
jgi:mRNA interferase MazF